jgi:hypothetical protein
MHSVFFVWTSSPMEKLCSLRTLPQATTAQLGEFQNCIPRGH